MKRKNENIELLIERFLDGRTTCAEERTLYDYFRTAQIPAEWEYLREAMRYFEHGIGACDAGVLPADAGGGRSGAPSCAAGRGVVGPAPPSHAAGRGGIARMHACGRDMGAVIVDAGRRGDRVDIRWELCPLRRRILQRRGCAPRPDRHSHDACRDNGDQGREAAGTG